jgi:hypothetical protein
VRTVRNTQIRSVDKELSLYFRGNTLRLATKPNRLMLFGETVAVYCENIRNTQIRSVDKELSLYLRRNTLRLATKPNRLMLFRETVAVYCENHTEHTNTL